MIYEYRFKGRSGEKPVQDTFTVFSAGEARKHAASLFERYKVSTTTQEKISTYPNRIMAVRICRHHLFESCLFGDRQYITSDGLGL